MKAKKSFLAFLIVFLLIARLDYSVAEAAIVGSWSADARVPGYLDDTFTPFLLADQNRTVHAFASQWVKNGEHRRAIVYRQWTPMGGWTRPVDIVLAPIGDAEMLGAFLDSSDRIHIIFMAGAGDFAAIYYAFAPAADADAAAAWSFPVLIDTALIDSAAIMGDDQDNLVIIYGGEGDGNGVYFLASSNGGESWSPPSPVFLTGESSFVPYSLALVRGPKNHLHATWNVVTSLGQDEALYFADYDVQNSKWSMPLELDRRVEVMEYFGPSFPEMVDNGREIVIMYNHGNPFPGGTVGVGRPVQLVRVSTDGGHTWSGQLYPFPFHVGRSGENALVSDGSGIPHALFIQRIEGTNAAGGYSVLGGIWHSAFKEGNWTKPQRLVTTYSPHDVRAVVSQGNVLLAVWREDPGAGQHGVWFSYTILDVPESPVVPLATSIATLPVQPSSTATPVLITPTPRPVNVLGDPAPPQWRNSPAFPLIAGVMPVILIVLATFIAYRFFIDRRT